MKYQLVPTDSWFDDVVKYIFMISSRRDRIIIDTHWISIQFLDKETHIDTNKQTHWTTLTTVHLIFYRCWYDILNQTLVFTEKWFEKGEHLRWYNCVVARLYRLVTPRGIKKEQHYS